ncbi:MAG: hypothetical protein JO097_20040 [Acidobacteriaceae bacterium]|nr:hypothetical protein [Acidobacteriaceae bacterium]MBV9295281.1 hypothetical protein [Acidobacteriaceae bacterium]MBV9766073.1 hypothetical protein [Acidobacteriaceae bacterium]
MPPRITPIDFVAYDRDGKVVLLAEAKSRHGTSDSWAAKLRRNMLAHGVLPKSQYFLIATPERIYGWRQENLLPVEVPPQFTVDAQKALAPYFSKLGQNPAQISPAAFELLVLTWLTDIARSGDQPHHDPSLRSLSESGLLSSLQQAEIEMYPAR